MSRTDVKRWEEGPDIPAGWGAPRGQEREAAPAWSQVTSQGPPLDERILIIDDCTLFRENLAAVFVINGFPPPYCAWDLASLVPALQDEQVRVVLVNTATRGRQLLLRAAMDINPRLRIIAFGASEEDETEIVECAEVGVVGYHVRNDSLKDLIALVHATANGMSSCPPRIAAILLRRLSSLALAPQTTEREPALTAREIQILRMLELGRSNRDIAAQLGIAVHTVKNHVHNLLTKLGVNTRAEAAALSRALRVDRGSPRQN